MTSLFPEDLEDGSSPNNNEPRVWNDFFPSANLGERQLLDVPWNTQQQQQVCDDGWGFRSAFGQQQQQQPFIQQPQMTSSFIQQPQMTSSFIQQPQMTSSFIQQQKFGSGSSGTVLSPFKSSNAPWHNNHVGFTRQNDEAFNQFQLPSPRSEHFSGISEDDGNDGMVSDEEGNRNFIPPPPGFGSPTPSNASSSSAIITSDMMKELEERLVALLDDTSQENNQRGTPVKYSPEKMKIHSFAGNDPIEVARYLDCILYTLHNHVFPAKDRCGQNDVPRSPVSRPFMNPVWDSFTGCVKSNMTENHMPCLGKVLNGEEMTMLLGAMNYAYFGPHQISQGSSAVLPKNSLYFWTQVKFEFLESMVKTSPEFFYSIPWKEYARNPAFSQESYHKLSMLAAEMRMITQSPKRGFCDSGIDSLPDTPSKRVKTPTSNLSPPARTRVYDPVNKEFVYECVFCKGNDQPERVYKSHPIRLGDKVVCPLLRKFRCRLCGATADNAHTIKYCPENEKGFFANHPSLANRVNIDSGVSGEGENGRSSFGSGIESNTFMNRQLTPTQAAWTTSLFRQKKPSVVRKLNFDIPSDNEFFGSRHYHQNQ